MDDETARKVKFYDAFIENEEMAEGLSATYELQKNAFLASIVEKRVAVDIQDGKVVDSETKKSVGELFELANGDLKLEATVIQKLCNSMNSDEDEKDKDVVMTLAPLVIFNSTMSRFRTS